MRQLAPFFLGFTFLLFFQQSMYAQVGIGTVTPDASSILEMESTTQGVLTPRMTTVQRNAILTPAKGLLVFDTVLNVFYFYNGSAWLPLEGSVTRNNYKLIKSAADLADELAAGGGAKYLLKTNYLYEINGTIALAAPIDLNDAYLTGADTNEDILDRATGNMFTGAKGGSIRNLTLKGTGATIFNLTGTGAENLIFRDCIVAGVASVGSVSSFNLVFSSIVQYAGNTAGVTYTNIKQLLLNNQGWHSTNGGTYEKFVGTFGIITKQGGFSQVTSATAAMDVTGITSITGTAGVRIVDFYGGGNYITGTSPYTGYKFTRDWDVNSPGISVETDGVATANFYFDGALTSGFSQTISNSTAVEIEGGGSFTANNLFRFTSPAGNKNRLVYDGKKTRQFQINASLSVRGVIVSGGAAYNFYYAFTIAKNGVPITESNAIIYLENGNQIQNVALNVNVSMQPTDYIEIYVQKLNATGSHRLDVFSENITIN